MKILGYIDDGITWLVKWQILIKWWNLLVIPIELFIIIYLYHRFIPSPPPL